MRFLWGERFDKTEQRDFGREVVLLVVVVKLVDLVMLYHYYDAHVFLIINFVMLKFKDFSR